MAISLSALLVFPQFFLRSFAYAGIATVVLAVIAAVVVLPGAARRARHAGQPLPRPPQSATEVRDDGFWFRLSDAVMRRPWPVLVGGVGLLVALGLPFLRVTFGQTDDRVLPAAPRRRRSAGEVLRTEFDSREADPLHGRRRREHRRRASAVRTYAAPLSEVDGVARVDSVTGSYVDGAQVAAAGPRPRRASPPSGTGTWLSVVTDVEPYSAEGEQVVEDLRAVAVAARRDARRRHRRRRSPTRRTAMGDRLPWAIGIIAIATFVLLFLFTGSVVLPAQGAGAQHAEPLGDVRRDGLDLPGGPPVAACSATSRSPVELDTAMPILMFCIAFGLSMDYEVFLLSRIKEEYDRTGDNTAAVAIGLQRTGRLITSAAALLAIVFIAFATQRRHDHQDARRRRGARGPRRRHHRARPAGARVHAGRGRRQLVGAGAAQAPARPDRPQRGRVDDDVRRDARTPVVVG